ncbi:aminotransferase class I/II-fold pyridoxal phosphate-dependent enzyme [Fructobacillus sp. M2-14]|uniref:Aminotransferase n=1 Tax=Fructobacillus broussonetiae TaxID=2713173 RepID=A0ABS5QYB6_9LACO|nr:aminotransferase class I/II-fold pyridoxal phosphate-dependent enzyme [Fructobacillus broussonetiae]MBS9338185.1 aminotransferase class I/II-fold pyridoxal phosphate-dependent enzyme [Fructobacillus broussonetiae]
MTNLKQALENTYNHRLDLVKASKIRSFDNEISAIPDLAKLTIGEPDLKTPEHIKQAAIRAMEEDQTHYTAQAGTAKIQEAIVGYLQRNHNLHYQADTEIVVTVGATEAIYAVFKTLVNPGDQFILPTPSFALYEPIITLLGGEVIDIDTSATNFRLSPTVLEDTLATHFKVKAVLLSYPNNPSGVTLTEDEVHALATVIKQHNVYAITDEIYSDLVYDFEPYSIARDSQDQTIYISGVSKAYAMTGWRIGFVAAPEAFLKRLRKVHAFMVTCPSAIDQAAAAEAFLNGDSDIETMRASYQERRDVLASGLTRLGLEYLKPAGAFYLFMKVPAEFEGDDRHFAITLAQEAKVGVIPGSAFGKGGNGYVRLSYASSMTVIKRALERIEQFKNEREN